MENASTPRRPRILVIDDNAAIHDDFRRILESHPAAPSPALDALEAELFGEVETSRPPAPPQLEFAIDVAYQGDEGIELVRQARAQGEPYALAFVDLRMPPGIDGIEALSRIFVEDPDIQGVFCSAYADLSWKKTTNWLWQVDRYLILKKPFEPVEVRQMAAALTAKWTHERERAQAHAALLDREARLLGLLDALPQAIARVDRQGRCLEYRPHQGGVDPCRGAVPSSLAEIAPGNEAPRLLALVARSMDQAATQWTELTIESPEGRRQFEVRATALGDGRFEAIVSLLDITERRRSEEQERALRERQIALQAEVETLGALSTPLVPITADVVVIPVIGVLDARRGERMRAALLEGIAARRSRVAILDVTGVPALDEGVAADLLKTAAAVRLLGAELVLTGMSPESARRLAERGAPLTAVRTFLTLQEAVRFAMGDGKGARVGEKRMA